MTCAVEALDDIFVSLEKQGLGRLLIQKLSKWREEENLRDHGRNVQKTNAKAEVWDSEPPIVQPFALFAALRGEPWADFQLLHRQHHRQYDDSHVLTCITNVYQIDRYAHPSSPSKRSQDRTDDPSQAAISVLWVQLTASGIRRLTAQSIHPLYNY